MAAHICEMGLPWMNACRGHRPVLTWTLNKYTGCSHFCIPFFCKRLAFRSEQGICYWWMSLRNVGMQMVQTPIGV